MIGYYDAVLALIPTVMFGLAGFLHGVGFDLTAAITLSALGAALVVGHAMFVRAPIDGVAAAVDEAHPAESKTPPTRGANPE